MKQKDKKLLKRTKDRLINVAIEDNDFYDQNQTDVTHKAKRTGEKSGQSFKNAMEIKTGRVVEIKSNYLCIVRIGAEEFTCSLSGRLKQFSFKTKMLLATGDWVEVDFSTAPHYRIENILPRRNALTRFSESGYQKEIIVASNLDNLVITVSWQMPMLKLGLVDRYICMAHIYGVQPIICINKMDLCEDRAEAADMTHYFAGLDIPLVFTSALTGEGLSELKLFLQDKDSVFSGQSGTGKSSLINALMPGLNLATKEVSSFNEKGVHTTTQAIFLKWDFGGNLVDTPGLKTINLHKNQKSLIPSVFPGFSDYTDHCFYRSCTHTHEENCAVLKAVEDDNIPIERYDSYLRIMESL